MRPTLNNSVRVLAFPATLIFPLSLTLNPRSPKVWKLGSNRFFKTNLMYLNRALYFQKLIRYSIALIQLIKNVGSLYFKAIISILNDSFKKSLGPNIR